MIRKILVYENALADKHPALERALQLAERNKVELRIVDVVAGPSEVLHELHRPMRSLVEQERKDRLLSICEPLHNLKIQFTTELIRGRPFVEIVREVVHEGIHLVIKEASGTQPMDADCTGAIGMIGPVDMRLVRNCPCPVWLEASGRDVRCERILVAIDPQAEDDEVNQVLLEMGVSLAAAAGGDLHVVSAWEVPDEDFLREKMKPEKLMQYADDVESAARQSLETLLKRAGNPADQKNVHFGKGDPAGTILAYAEAYQPDVVVMGTVAHTQVRGLLIGNTTDTVLRKTNCSVLAFKPDSLFRA